jgi:hypothetical protein
MERPQEKQRRLMKKRRDIDASLERSSSLQNWPFHAERIPRPDHLVNGHRLRVILSPWLILHRLTIEICIRSHLKSHKECETHVYRWEEWSQGGTIRANMVRKGLVNGGHS